MGLQSFAYCFNLQKLNFHEGLSRIGGSTFWECISLENLTISEGITAIGEGAFGGCTGLVSISLPKTLKILEEGAFSNFAGNEDMDMLREIYCYSETPPMPSTEVVMGWGAITDPFLHRNFKATVYVPEGCKDIYENNRVWGRFAKIEEMNTDGIKHKGKDEDSIVGIYTLRGERVQSSNHKGLFIVKMKDGSTKKMLKN